jgi:hypothetical protein
VLDQNAGTLLCGFTTFPRAAVEGFFYWNDGGTCSATDQTGHVLASTRLALNPNTGQPEARYFAVRCNDATCVTSTTISGAAMIRSASSSRTD